MTHPLTDEFIRSKFNGTLFDQNELGFEEDEMRAAADWQLEQVIEWIEASLMEDYRYTRPRSSAAYVDKEAFLEDLKKAMRPQEDN